MAQSWPWQLKKLLTKKIQDTATSSFISRCFTSALTSADIIFYNFLGPYSTFSEKKISFFNEFTIPHSP